MKTTAQLLTIAGIAVVSLFAVAAPARADHDHDHLRNVSRMAGEIADHARDLQQLVRHSPISFQERRELITDSASLQLSARRLQAFAHTGNISLVEREFSLLRQTTRHFADHAYGVGLGFSRAMRSELAAIESDLTYINRELAREVDHYGPRPVRPLVRPGFSFGGPGFSFSIR